MANMNMNAVKKMFSNIFFLKLLRCKPIRFKPKHIIAIDKMYTEWYLSLTDRPIETIHNTIANIPQTNPK